MAADGDRSGGELSDTDETGAAPAPSHRRRSASPKQTAPHKEPVGRTSAVDVSVSDAYDYDEAVDEAAADDDVDVDSGNETGVKQPRSHVRLATAAGVAVLVALALVAGWLKFQAYQAQQAEAQRDLFVQVGRQGALNLTTVDWQRADADVQRIMDSATGVFYDDFSKRRQPFIDVVKKAQSKSVGTVTEAGLESETGGEAQVLVAVSVNTSNLGAAEQAPRAWRMRISVQKVGDEAKVSNVAFVP
jgi:Mce-associated membrane protein